MPTWIIAEAGVNHNGSLTIAKQLIETAAEAGADAIKFQTFRADQLVVANAPKAAYQQKTTGVAESQLAMLKALELSVSDHHHLVEHAHQFGIAFLSTPFDSESLRLLVDIFQLQTIKIASGDLTYAPLLLDVARCAKRIILSTGMATIGEVEAALAVLAYGFVSPAQARPSRVAFEQAFYSDAGQAALQERVTLLHCTSEYPAPVDEVNLRVMDTMRQAFGLPVGYSDHTKGIHIPIAAVARGACVIEKHFTLDNQMVGPDHQASIEPLELKQMVKAIRDVERALGDGIKRPTASEWQTRLIARRSLVANGAHRAGEAMNLNCKRPGTGISPLYYWDWQGQKAQRALETDELL